MPRDWLIAGADGGIGSALADRLPDAIRTSRRPGSVNALSLDLAAEPDTWRLPEQVSVAFLCAAVTSIETCRTKPVESRLLNVERTVRLGEMLAARGAFVVFLSTNQVFDGTTPFRSVNDKPCPQTEYGRHKADAERAILALNGAVVRFTKVIAGVPPLFRVWAESLLKGQSIEPFADLFFSPVPLDIAVDVLIETGGRRESRIVHVSGDRDISYADVARRLTVKLDVSTGLVRPVAVASRGLRPEAAPPHTTLASDSPAPVWNTIDAALEQLVRRSLGDHHGRTPALDHSAELQPRGVPAALPRFVA